MCCSAMRYGRRLRPLPGSPAPLFKGFESEAPVLVLPLGDVDGGVYCLVDGLRALPGGSEVAGHPADLFAGVCLVAGSEPCPSSVCGPSVAAGVGFACGPRAVRALRTCTIPASRPSSPTFGNGAAGAPLAAPLARPQRYPSDWGGPEDRAEQCLACPAASGMRQPRPILVPPPPPHADPPPPPRCGMPCRIPYHTSTRLQGNKCRTKRSDVGCTNTHTVLCPPACVVQHCPGQPEAVHLGTDHPPPPLCALQSSCPCPGPAWGPSRRGPGGGGAGGGLLNADAGDSKIS